MVTNEQVIQALREVVAHIEAEVVRADAIFELMLERGQIHPLELKDAMESANAKQQARWNQVRAKLDSILEYDATAPKVAA